MDDKNKLNVFDGNFPKYLLSSEMKTTVER